MEPKSKQQCCKRIYDRSLIASRGYLCTRPASVERDSQWYCKTHDPEKAKQRDQARREKAAERNSISDCNESNGKRWCELLGAGQPLYEYGQGTYMGSYQRKIVLTFEEAELIAARLEQSKP